MRSELQYDKIFHEHLSYLTVYSVSQLMARFDMKITDVTFVPMNGGSFLFEIRHRDSSMPANDHASIDFETVIALNEPDGWKHFVQGVQEQRRAFVAAQSLQPRANAQRDIGVERRSRFVENEQPA